MPSTPRRRRFQAEAPPDPDQAEVKHIQPYQATKAYVCPGCDQEIPPGVGHKVVVPEGAPDLRRHWHSGCWAQATRRRPR